MLVGLRTQIVLLESPVVAPRPVEPRSVMMFLVLKHDIYLVLKSMLEKVAFKEKYLKHFDIITYFILFLLV
jgi:hypothetical protein